MLGDIIEQNGDGLLEESHMPVGWPLHIDGAVRQRCIHDSTLLELDDLLSEYDMKRDLAEINRKATLIKKDGGEMLIAIVLDKPLLEVQALVDNPDAFMLEITKTIQNKHAHPVIAQMLHPDVRDDLPPSECAPAYGDDESRAASNAISVSAYTLCRQRGIPTADGPTSRPCPTCTCLPVPFNGPTDQHGIPMAGLHAPGLHCIQCKFVVAFITSYYLCNLVFDFCVEL